MSDAPAPRPRRDAVVLAAGSAVTGLLAYVVFAICTRALGAEGAAGVSVLWTLWSFSAAVLTFPVQHWITRATAAAGGGRVVREVLPGLLAVGLGAAATITLGSWLLGSRLFPGGGLVLPLCAGVVVLGSLGVGVLRGGLATKQRFAGVAASLVGENAVRCVLVAALALRGVTAPEAYGVAIAAGHLVVLGSPGALRFSRTGARPGGSPWRLLGGTSLGQLLAQTVLTIAPVVLALAGGAPAQVTAMFATLALFRAPYQVVLGVVASVTGRLTDLVVRREQDQLVRVGRAVAAGGVVVTGLAVLLGGTVGPWLVRLVFGADVVVAGEVAAVAAAGSALAVVNLVLGVALVAHGRPRGITLAWLAGIAAAVVPLLLPGAAPLRIAAAFAVAELVATVLLLAAERRATVALGH